MKILILYAMAGGGHKTAALAVKEYLSRAFPHAEIRAEDGLKMLEKHSDLVDWACCDTYKWSAKKAPWAFGAGYRAADKDGLVAKMVPLTNAYLSRWLYPYLEGFQPDIIISTYHFLGQMVSSLVERKATGAKLIQLITDYAPCMPWICKAAHAYVVADEAMIPQMEERGVSASKVHPIGIPVRSAFFEKQDGTRLRKELGMDETLPAVLLMGGSFGVKKLLPIFKELNELPQAFQIVVIAGSDTSLENALRHAALGKRKPTLIRGFCTDVERYMRAADLLVTKPGGLTVSEALACDLPIVCYGAIPGQEEDNAQFLQNSGMGIFVGKESCAKAAAALLADRAVLGAMRQRCRAFDKSGCMEALPKLVAELTGQTGEL